MTRPWTITRPRSAAGWMAAGVCALVALLSWFGYRASEESQRTARLLVERRTGEAATLLARALSRDMRGVHASVLFSADWHEAMLAPPYEIQTLIAGAFTDYPYPESFFAWRGELRPEHIVFFDRAHRPSRRGAAPTPGQFPVVVSDATHVASTLALLITRNVTSDGRSSAFETVIDGVPYQVVTRLLYRDSFQERIAGGLGFTVNLEWARDVYFPQQVEQMRRIAGIGGELSLSISDERGRQITGESATDAAGPVSRRELALTFADPLLLGFRRPADLPNRLWAVAVRDPGAPSALVGFGQSASGAFILFAVAAAALALGLAMMAHAARSNAALAEMRSDFVATLTHELKTPIASIRALGDSVVSGRIADPGDVREYSQMVVEESKQLARLVDNALAYARIADVTEVYHFEAISLHDAVREALSRFAVRLAARAFTVVVEVPETLPAVRADRSALGLLLDNLIDNAIRYSGDTHALAIVGDTSEREARLVIRDSGIGIEADEVPNLGRKFFRGRGGLGRGGSGLGLAIVRRVVTAHHGRLDISSTVGIGTTVTLALPVAG